MSSSSPPPATFDTVSVARCPAGAAGRAAHPCRRFDGVSFHRVADGIDLDEAFYRRGCTGEWRPPR